MQIRFPMRASCKPPSFPGIHRQLSTERDRELLKQRTAIMNTSSDPTKGTRTIHFHISDLVQQKEEGYTVIVQPSSDAEITSDEIWRVALPGEYRGATRVDRLWHLYYAEDPGYSPGSWLDIALPDNFEEISVDSHGSDFQENAKVHTQTGALDRRSASK
jgi:hypothetical protein